MGEWVNGAHPLGMSSSLTSAKTQARWMRCSGSSKPPGSGSGATLRTCGQARIGAHRSGVRSPATRSSLSLVSPGGAPPAAGAIKGKSSTWPSRNSGSGLKTSHGFSRCGLDAAPDWYTGGLVPGRRGHPGRRHRVRQRRHVLPAVRLPVDRHAMTGDTRSVQSADCRPPRSRCHPAASCGSSRFPRGAGR
jgi:hypothetical protein